MKLRFIGLEEFIPGLPGDKQQVSNGDEIEVRNERLAEELLRTARWEEVKPAPKRPRVPKKPVEVKPVEVPEKPLLTRASSKGKGVENE